MSSKLKRYIAARPKPIDGTIRYTKMTYAPFNGDSEPRSKNGASIEEKVAYLEARYRAGTPIGGFKDKSFIQRMLHGLNTSGASDAKKVLTWPYEKVKWHESMQIFFDLSSKGNKRLLDQRWKVQVKLSSWGWQEAQAHFSVVTRDNTSWIVKLAKPEDGKTVNPSLYRELTVPISIEDRAIKTSGGHKDICDRFISQTHTLINSKGLAPLEHHPFHTAQRLPIDLVNAATYIIHKEGTPDILKGGYGEHEDAYKAPIHVRAFLDLLKSKFRFSPADQSQLLVALDYKNRGKYEQMVATLEKWVQSQTQADKKHPPFLDFKKVMMTLHALDAYSPSSREEPPVSAEQLVQYLGHTVFPHSNHESNVLMLSTIIQFWPIIAGGPIDWACDTKDAFIADEMKKAVIDYMATPMAELRSYGVPDLLSQLPKSEVRSIFTGILPSDLENGYAHSRLELFLDQFHEVELLQRSYSGSYRFDRVYGSIDSEFNMPNPGTVSNSPKQDPSRPRPSTEADEQAAQKPVHGFA